MVVSDFTFEHIENPAYVARELDRILAPGVGFALARLIGMTTFRWQIGFSLIPFGTA